ILKAHDRRRLGVTALTQPRGEKRVRKALLRRRHFLERKPFAFSRNEMPVEPLVVLELISRLAFLFRRQGGEKIPGSISHVFRRSVRADGWSGKKRYKQQSRKDADGFHVGESRLPVAKRKLKMRCRQFQFPILKFRLPLSA